MKNNWFIAFWCCLLFILLESCKHGGTDPTDYLVNSTEFAEDNLSNLVKINRVIPLETNDSSLLSAISSVKKRQGRYYIISKYRPYVFDENGEFLFMPSRLGHGPGEYSQQVNCMDADSAYIYLYAPPKLITLTLDGKFVNEVSTDWGWGGQFRKIPQGFLTVTENMPDSTHIGFYDNNLMPITKDAKFAEQINLSFNGVWAKWDDRFYIQNDGKSTDFYLFDTQNNSFSRIKFSNRKDGLTTEEYYYLAWKQGKSDAEIPNFLVSSPQSFGENCLWVCKDSDAWQVYYQKGNSHSAKILKPKSDDVTNLESPTKFLDYSILANSDENQLITILNIEDILFDSDFYINRRGIFSKLDSISPDSNPIIIEFDVL